MKELIIIAVSVAALVTGFFEVVKITFKINKRFIPISAIITGMIVCGLAYFLDVSLVDRLWVGAIAGLMSTGLFEAAKQLGKGDK